MHTHTQTIAFLLPYTPAVDQVLHLHGPAALHEVVHRPDAKVGGGHIRVDGTGVEQDAKQPLVGAVALFRQRALATKLVKQKGRYLHDRLAFVPLGDTGFFVRAAAEDKADAVLFYVHVHVPCCALVISRGEPLALAVLHAVVCLCVLPD